MTILDIQLVPRKKNKYKVHLQGGMDLVLYKREVKTYGLEAGEELSEDSGRTNLHGPVTVINTPGVELPATGGPGTLGYILLGMSLILAAGGAIWYNKKKAVRERD